MRTSWNASWKVNQMKREAGRTCRRPAISLIYGKVKGGAAYREEENGQTDDEPAHGAASCEAVREGACAFKRMCRAYGDDAGECHSARHRKGVSRNGRSRIKKRQLLGVFEQLPFCMVNEAIKLRDYLFCCRIWKQCGTAALPKWNTRRDEDRLARGEIPPAVQVLQGFTAYTGLRVPKSVPMKMKKSG